MDKPEILTYPDPKLRRTAEPVDEVTPEIRERIAEMFEVMVEDRGIGLAAPQIGWNVRIFVMNLTGKPEDNVALINPTITERVGRAKAEEGCLSLPGIYAKVERPKRIVMEGTTPEGEQVAIEADGLTARCLQHEFDHLDGILFIDRVSPISKRRIKKKLEALEQRYKDALTEVSA